MRQSAWAAVTERQSWGLKQQTLVFSPSGGQKSEMIQGVSRVGSFWGLSPWPAGGRLHAVFPRHVSVPYSPLLRRKPVLLGQGPSQPSHFNLSTSLKTPSPNTVT